jgi:hypothetical protein
LGQRATGIGIDKQVARIRPILAIFAFLPTAFDRRLSSMKSILRSAHVTNVLKATAIVASALFLNGCASIMNSGARSISMKTVPTGASVKVFKEGGDQVHSGATPMTVSLDPSRGFFRGQAYVVKFEMPGYRPAELTIRPEISGWYFGNLIFGGPLGLLIIDPATGSMWNLSPEKIEQSLSRDQASVISEGKGFVVALLSELSPSERTSLTRIK